MKTIIYKRKVFFNKKDVCSIGIILKKYGVKGNSYAGNVLKRIYHYYFGDSVNLYKEYKKYYKKEFKTYDNYLECHLGLPDELRRKIVYRKIFYVNLEGKGEHIGDSFLYDDELKEQFWEFAGGIEYENQNWLCNEQFFY